MALLPSVAVAFAVSTAAIIWVMTVRSSSRLISPFLGNFSDRFGRRAVLLPSLALFALGNLGAALPSSLVVFIAAQGLVGLGLTGLQVSLPTYLGDLFPYEVRGRAIGTATVCAACGTMLGVPAAAFLAQGLGVHTAFLALGLLIAVLFPLTVAFLRAPTRAEAHTETAAEPAMAWHAPLRRRPVRAALFVTFCWLTISACIYTFLSVWLQGPMRLSPGQVGLVFSMMGAASIVANLLIASFSDRLGKRRAMLIGLALGTASLAPLGLAVAPWQALVAIAFFVLTNEFGFGAHGVLVTELAPAQRGMVVSLYMLAWGIGVTIAPQVAGLLWRVGGFPAVALSMMAVGLAAWLVGYFFVVSPAAGVQSAVVGASNV
jgi:predicted MFS family arabinose efflux permease